jgi:diguanylate cyclase (GGDEF)-like protein
VVYETCQPYILKDAQQEYVIFRQTPHNRIHGWMGIPLIFQNRFIGIVALDSIQPAAFTADHSRLASAFADQVVIALENARLYQEALATIEHSDTIRQAIQEISSASLDPEETYQAIYRATVKLMPADAFVISLVDWKHDLIRHVYLFDQNQKWPAQTTSMDQCFAGYLVQNPRTILIDNIKNFHQSKYKFLHFGGTKKIRSGLAVPLSRGEKIIGTIFTQSYQPDAYTPEHQNTLELIAAPAAVALENAQLYAEVHRLAITDSLTELYNRRHFFSLAQQECERSSRFGHPFSIAMLDIDHFKQINDSYGHLVGDQVLRALANLCQKVVRKVDILGRYGGEEFIILLPETDTAQAFQVAERLREKIYSTPLRTDVGEFFITTSIGIATPVCSSNITVRPNRRLEDIINQADQALYQAKQSGRNRVSVWNTDKEHL